MKKFELTADHLTLLQNMYVDWDECETGAPCINPKRPYGNSNVERDIVIILGWIKTSDLSIAEDEDDAELQRLFHKAEELHKDTQTALQICLVTGKFEPGIYEKQMEWDRRSWKKIS